MDHLWSPWRYQYVQKEKTGGGCVFCQAAAAERDEENLVVYRARKNYIILNLYPYSTGHLMVVPYEHVDMLQYASQETLEEMILLVQRAQIHLQEIYRPPGFNLGNESGGKRGRRNRRAHSHARAAALAGRHQFHDHGRRNARAAGRFVDHLAQAARSICEERIVRVQKILHIRAAMRSMRISNRMLRMAARNELLQAVLVS